MKIYHPLILQKDNMLFLNVVSVNLIKLLLI